MRNILFKDTLQEIKHSKKRFFSILIMAFLGVGFFAGIKATSPDMKNTIDNYYNIHNVYDIKILSTMGLTGNDLSQLKTVNEISDLYGSYSKDVEVLLNDRTTISRLYTLSSNVNTIDITSGNSIINYDECLVESEFLLANNLSIGSSITLTANNISNDLQTTTLKIVGTATSPMYISKNRGTTSLGDGTIDCYIYISQENVKSDLYTEIFVTTKNSSNFNTCSPEYSDYIENVKNEIELIKTQREQARYDEIVNALNTSKKEHNSKKFEGKIEQVKLDIENIERPKWYILDRNSNEGFNSFKQDSDSIANVGKVFPIVFFVIAILISLTTMTRMVEENRMQIGTFKTLGYSNLQIASKYIIYALLACLIGGIFGMCIGFIIIPRIIWIMYSMLYSIPDFKSNFNFYYGIIGILAINLCIVGATWSAIIKEIIQMPATLMRPKAPKIGKRVLLERMPFVWKHFSFIQKVTARNMFRYKKRLLLTIIGIFGCTSLIVTGFGIKDSIAKLIPDQYGKIFNYDLSVTLKDDLSVDSYNLFYAELENNSNINEIIPCYVNSLSIRGNAEKAEDIQIIVPDNNNKFSKAININDVKTNQTINLADNEIILTDKLAQLLDVQAGDSVALIDNNQEHIVTISNITENYISHYAYISKPLYEKLFSSYKINTIYLTCKDLSESEEDNLTTKLIDSGYIAGVVKSSYVKGLMDNMTSSLNYVVIVLIVSSGLLAFVVLYNLANINISERIRELATIKVLGFYPKEIFDYLNRETMILTIIGIILGLAGGYLLNYFIMETCEINILRFSKTIKSISYLYSGLITLVFTLIVNFFTYCTLKKINMIESLKSVE